MSERLLGQLAEMLKANEGSTYECLAAEINVKFIVPLQLELDRAKDIARDYCAALTVVHAQYNQMRDSLGPLVHEAETKARGDHE